MKTIKELKKEMLLGIEREKFLQENSTIKIGKMKNLITIETIISKMNAEINK